MRGPGGARSVRERGRGGRRRKDEGGEGKRKEKRKWKKREREREESEREIRAALIAASIAGPVDRIQRSRVRADEATGKRGRGVLEIGRLE